MRITRREVFRYKSRGWFFSLLFTFAFCSYALGGHDKNLEGYLGEDIYVFRENQKNLWTLWSADQKVHLGYSKALLLESAEFFVDQEKRRRVLQRGKKEPHAGVFGKLIAVNKVSAELSRGRVARYNPFELEHFVDLASGRALLGARRVYFAEGQRPEIFISYPRYRPKKLKEVKLKSGCPHELARSLGSRSPL